MARKTRKKSAGSSTATGDNIYYPLMLKLLAVLVLFFISRIIFWLINYHYYSTLGTSELLKIFLAGIRFDVSAVFIINAPFILLSTIPFRFRGNKIWQRVLNVWFCLVNSIGLMSNFIDMIYFRFTLKRTTADIFMYLGVGGDFDKLIPQFLKDFWFIAVIWIIFVMILIWVAVKFRSKGTSKTKAGNGSHFYIVNSILFLIILFVSVIAIRGGFQLRPINIVTAGNYTSAKNVPLLINTPFAIAKTWGDEPLKPVTWFKKESELEKVYSPVHHADTTGFKKMNVMVIIMESFSAEHLGVLNRNQDNGNYKGYTPFLDSLSTRSYIVSGFANGKTSIQGIPAVLSGIPSLMNESFIQSGYSADHFISLAAALKEKGYTTAFFHGGTNGTMGFDSYSRLAGFDRYYGRSEYNNEKDYDGKWGIRDEEFFQYTANILNSFSQPFMASIFSLSSHHPYTVPPKYRNTFREGNLPIQKSVMYADYSLKRFFQTAEKMPWFKNTIFVITADHTSEGFFPWYQTDAGQYNIPILFYNPGEVIQGSKNIIVQQTDIMPTVLDILGYDKDYLAFGSSISDPAAPRFSVHYISGLYGLIMDGYMLQFDGTKTIALFDLKNDSLQKNNIYEKRPDIRQKLETFLKAYIQQYNNRVVENRLTVE